VGIHFRLELLRRKLVLTFPSELIEDEPQLLKEELCLTVAAESVIRPLNHLFIVSLPDRRIGILSNMIHLPFHRAHKAFMAIFNIL
jgi:hypothetical protein